MTDTAEIVELFGVRFTGRRNAEGRIYVPVTAESRLGLAALGKVGREMIRAEANLPIDADTKSCGSKGALADGETPAQR